MVPLAQCSAIQPADVSRHQIQRIALRECSLIPTKKYSHARRALHLAATIKQLLQSNIRDACGRRVPPVRSPTTGLVESTPLY